MGDSTLIEFLRDLSIVIASGVLVLSLLVMVVIALLLYKKLNAVLLAVRQTAANMQESAQAVRNSFTGRNPLLGLATAGLGKAMGVLFRAATSRRSRANEKQ